MKSTLYSSLITVEPAFLLLKPVSPLVEIEALAHTKVVYMIGNHF